MHLFSANPICGLCVSPFERSVLVDIHSDAGKALNLIEMLSQYIPFPILYKSSRSGSQLVCNTCLRNLQLWHTFITNCSEAQNKLRREWQKLVNTERNVKGTNKQSEMLHSQSHQLTIALSSVDCKKSSNYCISRWCSNGNYRGVSLFRIPKERDRALLWIKSAERTDLKDLKDLSNYYLCGNHFTSKMFTNKACNKLVKKAMPTVFPKPLYAHKKTKTASFQYMPTAFMGVPLKTILPKVMEDKCQVTNRENITNVENLSPSPVPLPQETLKVCSSGNNEPSPMPCSFVLKVVSSDCAAGNVNSISEDVTKKTLCSFESFKFGEALILQNDSPSNTLSGNQNLLKAESGISHSKMVQDQKNLIDSESQRVTGSPESQQKLQVPNSIKEVHSVDSTFIQAKRQQSPHSKKSKILEEGCDLFSCNEIYSSTAGSQDLLLPNLVEKVEKTDSNFQEQNMTLACEISHDSQGNHQSTNEDIELNNTNTLFDLQADVHESAVYMQQISNLDELMDLDHFLKTTE